MDSAKISDWLQIVGMFGVIASLVFVGLQLKQSHEIALADYFQAQNSASMAHFDAMIQGQITGAGDRRFSSEQLAPSDVRAQFWNAHWNWSALDNNHYKYRAGFLSEETWNAQLQRLQTIFARCEMRFVYESRKPSFRSSLVVLIESLEDPCNQDEQGS